VNETSTSEQAETINTAFNTLIKRTFLTEDALHTMLTDMWAPEITADELIDRVLNR
jgi:hypothetical protein